PFGKDLAETVRTQNVGARPLSVRRITQALRDNSCQIVFVSVSEESRYAQIIEAMKTLPILTVGEESNFIRAGGMISFVIEDNRIRFEINLSPAEKAGIKISSKLLKLAKIVHERGGH
ncbi:MAG: YfiR family protein, partial [Deltaproteobacteria bacterium]|nr:YfiR family protein [Deltaproteobacteria bacterium]